MQHGWPIEMEGSDYQILDNPKLAIIVKGRHTLIKSLLRLSS